MMFSSKLMNTAWHSAPSATNDQRQMHGEIKIQVPEKLKFLWEPKRYKVMYGGRGGAKSHSIARVLLVMGTVNTLRIVCAREIQKSIKDSVHQLLADVIRLYGLESHYDILATEIRGKNGTTFKFVGLKHNVSEIKSLEGADILWVEEAENVSDNSWEVVIPTIRKANSEIWVSFNVKSVNDPTYRRFVASPSPDCIAVKVGWQDNPWFPEVLEAERQKLQLSDPEAYAHIWDGQPDTRRSGAVYAKQMAKAREEGRITRVPYDPGSQVLAVFDLGYGDATAIWWVQYIGRELRWLEYYENSGEQLDHYAKIVKSKPYNYFRTSCVLPHDGGHGNIRGESVTIQLDQMGLTNIVLDRENDIIPGIELLRRTIAFSVFDDEKCVDGIHALENYAYEWDDERKTFKDKPKHDWTSHCADCARYVARAVSLGLLRNDGYAYNDNDLPEADSWLEM